MNLAKLIKDEKITLTDRVMEVKPNGKVVEHDYFIYWKMEGRKTIWEKGIIQLVDNSRVYSSFREALEKKYEIRIPRTKLMKYLINKKIEELRKFHE